jgi:ABC-type cobalamin/Fe3+-siderophores transport system ATPase subunit
MLREGIAGDCEVLLLDEWDAHLDYEHIEELHLLLDKLATEMLLSYAFNELALHRVSLEVVSFNQLAISLYQKLGFVKEGILRDSVYSEGKYHDIWVMSLLRHEY